MALIMGKDVGLVFYNKVLGEDSPSVKHIQSLIEKGVQFEDGLYTLKAIYKGKVLQHNLKVGSSALMKGSVAPVVLLDEKVKIVNFIATVKETFEKEFYTDFLFETLSETAAQNPDQYSILLSGVKGSTNKIECIKALRAAFFLDLYNAKKNYDLIAEGKPQYLTVPNFFTLEQAKKHQQKLQEAGFFCTVVNADNNSVVPMEAPPKESILQKIAKDLKPANSIAAGVISLRDAAAIGQPVKGSSDNSIYRCIAYNDRVKVAARVKKSGTISIRAEWKNAVPSEITYLAKAGLEVKDKYASMHLDSAGVPAAKVLGAFLMDTGLDFQEIVKPSQIVVED